MKRNCGVYVAGCAILVASQSAWAGFVDYNTPGDLSANFNLNNDGAGNRYLEVTSGGRAGSGAADVMSAVDAVHTTALFNQESYQLTAVGESVTVSQYVLRQANAPFPFQFSFVQLGVLTDTAGRLGSSSAGDSYASLRLLSDFDAGGDGRVFLQTEVKSSESDRTQENITGQSADLVAGRWYRFRVTIKYVSDTVIQITGALEDRGTDGLGFAGTILELNEGDPQSLIDLSALPGATVLGDSTVFAGWRGFDEGGADVFDDFAAGVAAGASVPTVSEWGVVAMAMLLGTVGTIGIRRRLRSPC